MTFFLNLFIRENCWSFARTFSPKGISGTLSAFCIHRLPTCISVILTVSAMRNNKNTLMYTTTLEAVFENRKMECKIL